MENTQAAIALARRFLETLEQRDLDAAAKMLAPQAQMIFPGPHTFSNLPELVAFARQRYQWVRKNIEGIEAMNQPDGDAVVYIKGELYGLNLHDVEFSGVRFIDRFVISKGLIVLQEVWNDLAESGALELPKAN